MGLETSKHAAATYQPKDEYATKYDLGSYVLNNDFNTYKQDTTNYLNNDLRKFTDNTYQPKGNPFMPLPQGNGGYMTTSKTYDVNIAGKNYKTKGNAILSLEDKGIAIQSLDGTGNGSQLFLSNNGLIGLTDLSGKGGLLLLNGEVNLISSTDKFCFNKICFTSQDMQTLYNNLPVKQPQSVGDNVTVLKPSSQYLRTRNYLHY